MRRGQAERVLATRSGEAPGQFLGISLGEATEMLAEAGAGGSGEESLRAAPCPAHGLSFNPAASLQEATGAQRRDAGAWDPPFPLANIFTLIPATITVGR